MAENKDGRFRQRMAEVGGGLKTTQAKPRLPSVEGLKINTSFDLSKLESFAPTTDALTGVAEKLKPQASGGLRVETDFSRLDEGIEKIKRQQINEKIRGLIEEADRLIKKKKFRPALKPLDKALNLDPTSSQALLLKGHCLFNLEEYENAIAALDEAQRHTRDAETQFLIVMLREVCREALLERLAAELTELIEEKKYAQALDRIEVELRRRPQDMTLLYYKCGVLFMAGRGAEAKQVATEAMRRADPHTAQMFRVLLDEFAVRESLPYLEAARAALRRGNPDQALQQLERCRAAMAGAEQFEAVRAYAEEIKPRGFFKAIFSRAQAKPLTDELRQRMLGWLLAEELAGGLAALNAQKYDLAVNVFEQAQRIDSRCRIICFLLGVAYLQGFRNAMEDEQGLPDLDETIQKLEGAASLLRYAGADEIVGEQSRLALKALNNDLSELQKIKSEIARQLEAAKPINDLIRDFNALMDGLERNRISSPGDAEQAERRFRDLKQRAEQLRRRHTSGEAGEILQQFGKAIDRNLQQIGEIRDEMKKYRSVTECFESFEAMMKHFERNPIRDRRGLDEARRKVRELKDKISKARGEHYRGSDAWKALDQVEEAVRNVESQLYQ